MYMAREPFRTFNLAIDAKPSSNSLVPIRYNRLLDPARKDLNMSRYYVNKNAQNNGDHEVHTPGCSHMPNPENRHYLGDFTSCQPAVTEAKKIYPQSNGCYYCSRECNTG